MYEFIKGREGDVFCIFVNLAEASGTTIVTPRAALKGAQPSNAGERLQQDGRLIVLGWCWWVRFAAASDAIGMAFRQHVGSPASGDSVNRTFFNYIGNAAGQDSGSSGPTYVEADKGAFTPLANASELIYVKAGTPTGGILVWGLHTDGSDPARSKLHTYSPGLNYNTGS